MNQTMKELMERKSVRVYKEQKIEQEKKAAIIEAALQAPTAGNMTLYSIIDVTDPELKKKLSVTCDNQPFIAQAPMVLVFVADYQKWYDLFCKYEDMVRAPGMGDFMLAADDALIAAQNAVVAAQSLGIGSCYIGDILEQYETHRELFSLPRYAVPAAMVVFGYPVQQQIERVKPSRLRPEAVVFENIYRRLNTEEFQSELNRVTDRGEDFERWIKAFCSRKWNSDFSREMSRSVKAMMNQWENEGQQSDEA
ncbi:nitroreductase family protein [Clostridium boliviensis]|uniref:Nitroreductase family protein n=1 Tax=Clostridium boliviensis TaxID=318465 RepID=A0ABU4GM47_9CLOT|nr:nitroreductase family protein [Clostridium boliviensis]MDW2798683.1 nitroreductase family protein [Clostridium boliviensis]